MSLDLLAALPFLLVQELADPSMAQLSHTKVEQEPSSFHFAKGVSPRYGVLFLMFKAARQFQEQS